METPKKSILIIDDETVFAELLKLNIEAALPYECRLAAGGAEGLRQIAARRPDLVLLDIKMPEMNGPEVLARIKMLDAGIPVCMVTAIWDDAQGRECLKAGAFDYITKPVDFTYLETVLASKLLP